MGEVRSGKGARDMIDPVRSKNYTTNIDNVRMLEGHKPQLRTKGKPQTQQDFYP